MHGETPKLHTAPSGAQSSSKHWFPHGHAPTRRVGGSKFVLLAVLLVAQLMVILDITAVNIALPTLSRDLDIVTSDVLPFLFQDRLNIRRGTRRDRDQKQFQRARRSSSITFGVNRLGVTAGRRSDKKIIARVMYCCLIFVSCHDVLGL